MPINRIGGKHTNRTEISVSVRILSTDGQAALRNKKYVADVSILGSETVGLSALECLRIQIFYLHSPVSML